MKKLVTLFALTAVFNAPVGAATKTVTLSIPGMTCAACPITVKKALTKLKGVAKTEVSFERKEAVVTFDDAQTNVSALIEHHGRGVSIACGSLR